MSMKTASARRPLWCFISVAFLLLSLLGIGIIARVKGVAEGTEIIFSALGGIGILVNAWIDELRRDDRTPP
jgi:hypothetical protein